MKATSKKLHEIAKKTYENGNERDAKRILCMAMTSEDSLDTLDKLMPQAPESDLSREEIKELEAPEHEKPPELTGAQVAKIRAIAQELEKRDLTKISKAILAKLDRTPMKKSRK